jgi:RNA polymerase sigma-70 factor, ECF subfamily
LRNPSEESFVSVYRSLWVPLKRYFVVRGLDQFTAEEHVQDVLLTLYRRSGEVRNKLCITGWIYQVARNVLLQHARKHRLAAESLTGQNCDEIMSRRSDQPFRIPQESELFEWIQVLDEDEQEICLMRYMDGLEYQSIAEALEIPMGTVKWKLHQIKKKIAARLRIGSIGRR